MRCDRERCIREVAHHGVVIDLEVDWFRGLVHVVIGHARIALLLWSRSFAPDQLLGLRLLLPSRALQ